VFLLVNNFAKQKEKTTLAVPTTSSNSLVMALEYLKKRSDQTSGAAAAMAVGPDVPLLVKNIINDIGSNGDAALRSYSAKSHHHPV
jgi:histidinol dehydrogenase